MASEFRLIVGYDEAACRNLSRACKVARLVKVNKKKQLHACRAMYFSDVDIKLTDPFAEILIFTPRLTHMAHLQKGLMSPELVTCGIF